MPEPDYPYSELNKAHYIELFDDLLNTLFPICRSITGKGIRDSFEILNKYIPLNISSVPSGTEVFDWTIPDEWNIEDAYIKNSKGERVIDFKQSNLHVISYSEPTHKKMSLEELKPFLHTIPDLPDAIPYITSYYERAWGFCLTQKQFDRLGEDTYEVVIDSELKPGVLNYGDLVLKGHSDKEVMFSSYLCHPSMANNELSGPVLLTALYDYLKNQKNLHYSYVPEYINQMRPYEENAIYGFQKLDGYRIMGSYIKHLGDTATATLKVQIDILD